MRTIRKMSFVAMLGAALIWCAGAAPGAENLLENGSFEEVAGGRPAKWTPQNFRTAGEALPGEGGGHTGARYGALISKSATDRAAFQQKVRVAAGTKCVAFGGWYRTKGVASEKSRGASLRILFHRDFDKWDEISLRPIFFPPSADWSETKTVFELPEGTVAVVMEAFNFFGVGEVDWDDVWLRAATEEEVATAASHFNADEAIDRAPVAGENKPYSPADGARVTLNPPPFLWLPSGKTGAVTYRLEIDTKPDFSSGDRIEFKDLIWRCKMLTEQLRPGTWYWRYGVDKRGPRTVWSQVRRFEVPADASEWKYPGRDAFKVGARPRMFVKPGGLADLRRRASEGDLRKEAASVVSTAHGCEGEALYAEPPLLPTDSGERKKVYTTIIRESRRPMDLMETCGLAYLLTGDKRAGLEAKRRLLHFAKWDPLGSTDVFHNDEPAMWVMMRGTRAYDWTYDLFTAEERKTVEDSMRVRARRFYEQLSGMPYDNRPYSSHPSRTIGFLGEAAISFLDEWPEARDYLEYITQIYWGVYPAWGTDDGGWNEGPGYWAAYMSFGLHFVMALREATGTDLSRRPFFHHTPYYRLYITPPQSAMSPFGDGTQFRPAPAGGLMYAFSSINRDSIIRWYADTLGAGPDSSIMGVLSKDASLKGTPPVDLPQGVLFDGVGLASLHTALATGDDDIHFAFKCSPYGAVSHGHNEQNCFVIEAFREALAVNSGYYNYYGSPHHTGWTQQTKAKNGITCDGGIGQDRGWHATGTIQSFVHGEAFDLIVGDATKSYGGRLSRAVREVVQVRPGIFVVRDDLASDKAHTFEYQLHAIDPMKIDEAARTILISRPGATLFARFLAPEKVRITQTDKFDPAPAWPPNQKFDNNWHATTSIVEPAQAAEFLSVLQVSRPSAPAEPAKVRGLDTAVLYGVELAQEGNARTVVGFAKVGARPPYALEGVETDAPVFAVTFGGTGEPTAWLGRNATYLRAGGRELVKASAAMTVTAAPDAGFGRVDTDGAGGRVSVWWPWRAVCATRGKEKAVSETGANAVAFDAGVGRDRLVVWQEEPGDEQEVKVVAAFGGKETELSGKRYMSGQSAVSGIVDAPAGVYRAPELPKTVRLTLGSADGEGRLWVRRGEAVSLSGRRLPRRVDFALVSALGNLPAEAQAKIPAGGVAHEAEAGWETSAVGGVSQSKGGHQHVSGGDNLWAWNDAGNTLSWDIEAASAGDYEMWVVGASEVGLLMDLRMDGGESVPLWFEPSGGWGRSVASEWAAYHVADGSGKPVVFRLAAGKHRLTMTNRSGLGLNLDRFVFVKR